MLLWQWGYGNVVSLEGKSISPYQVRMLKDMKAVIVFALDFDVTEEEIARTTSGLKSRVVYVVGKVNNISIAKQSPVDFGKQVWDNVYGDKRKI
jgi:DNA primase